MQTIIITLDPEKLDNPDLDLRYTLPEQLEQWTHGAVTVNGYDYLDDQLLGIWLETESAEEAYPLVVDLLQKKTFMDNDLSQSAEIYISPLEAADLAQCQQVYPEF